MKNEALDMALSIPFQLEGLKYASAIDYASKANKKIRDKAQRTRINLRRRLKKSRSVRKVR